MTPYTDKDAERADKPRFKQFTLHAYSERYSPGIKHDGPNRRVYDADEVDAALADHERLREAATRADELAAAAIRMPDACLDRDDPRYDWWHEVLSPAVHAYRESRDPASDLNPQEGEHG